MRHSPMRAARPRSIPSAFWTKSVIGNTTPSATLPPACIAFAVREFRL
jgi:hypothetical protein